MISENTSTKMSRPLSGGELDKALVVLSFLEITQVHAVTSIDIDL